MNINTNNYQELLLLYVDGELQPHEMDAVDEFVAKNYEAKEELDLLLNTKLDSIDNEEFKGLPKDALFKFENDEINLHNYPAYFVEYVNDALSDTHKKQVETFAKSNQQIKKEFELYQQTKALPDYAVVFENKEVLYKKVAKRPIVFMYFKQFSAAAILIGIIATTFILLSKEPSVDTVKTAIEVKDSKQNPQDINTTSINKQNNASINPSLIQNNNKVTTEKNKVTLKEVDFTKTNSVNNEVVNNKTSNNNNNSSTPLPINSLQTENDVAKNQATSVTTSNETTNQTKPIQTLTTNDVANNTTTNTANTVANNNALNNSIAKNIVFKTLDVDAENDNTVYVGNLKLNKQKVNGLLGKVGKIFKKSKKAQLEDVATSTASL